MKLLITTSLFLSVFALTSNRVSAQASIGVATPDASAMLDITATGKGLLIPRMTAANRPAAPATGLLIYQTDGTAGFYVYNGTAWTAVSGSGSAASRDSIDITTTAVSPFTGTGAYGPYFFSPKPIQGSASSINKDYTAALTSSGQTALSGYVVPKACTFNEIRLAGRVTPFVPAGTGSPNTTTVTLYKNGAATSMTVSITTGVSAGSTGSAVYSSSTVSAVAGDIISYSYTQTNEEPFTLYTVVLKGY